MWFLLCAVMYRASKAITAQYSGKFCYKSRIILTVFETIIAEVSAPLPLTAVSVLMWKFFRDFVQLSHWKMPSKVSTPEPKLLYVSVLCVPKCLERRCINRVAEFLKVPKHNPSTSNFRRKQKDNTLLFQYTLQSYHSICQKTPYATSIRYSIIGLGT